MSSWLKRQPRSRLLLVSFVVVVVSLTLIAWLTDPDNQETLQRKVAQSHAQVQGQSDVVSGPAATSKAATSSSGSSARPTSTAPASDKQTEAERIARLERRIEDGEAELKSLQQKLDNPESDYHKAQASFRELDRKVETAEKELKKLKQQNKTMEITAAEAVLAPLRKQRERAKERFDLALQERKTLQDKLAALPAKIQKERQALEKLTGANKAGTKPKPEEVGSAPTKPTTDSGVTASGSDRNKPTEPKKTPSESPGTTSALGKSNKADRIRTEAQAKATEKEQKAQQALTKVDSISEYIDRLKEQILLEQSLLDTARRKVDQATRDQEEEQEDQNKRIAGGADEQEVQVAAERINEAILRKDEANNEITVITDRLNDLQDLLTRVQGRRIQALQDAEKSNQEAQDAREKLSSLENPFTLNNILQWFLDHGPRLLVIVFGVLFMHRIAQLGSKRIVHFMTGTRAGQERIELADRADTLVGVFRNLASLLILGGGALMLLDEIGIPIVPLMGGAAVFGLAIAFGAQNLIKDYFSGFMVLLEDQYAVNDVVKIGDVEGQVERITLRITVVRDINGSVHFVPHGTISTVTNMTHGWSRALFDIGVAYKEDVDQVMAVLLDLGRQLRRDGKFGPLILEDPEMLGVDKLDDSAIIIKFFIKTRPLKQWLVKRELLRRIKNQFDQLGIEIPFPHRTIYHRNGDPEEVAQPELRKQSA